MEKPDKHQNLRAKLEALNYQRVLVYAGWATLYLTALALMIILPIKLIPHTGDQDKGDNQNVTNSNNHLPSYCPAYTVVANGEGTPLSDGPLKLPFQRPQESCRTFTSAAMEKLIANVTSRMVDKDLARLFENTYPNTLGSSENERANNRYYGVLV
jgi:hypothetical protein